MDFTFSEEQQAVAAVAEQIFTGRAPVERLKEIERTADRHDPQLWRELADANLLGVSLPEADGGSGLGVIELCLMLEQQGRRLAPVPLLWTAVAAMTLAEFGHRSRLGAVLSGDAIFTLALAEPGAGDPFTPDVLATPTGSGWSLTGTKPSVPAAHLAEGVVLPARVAGSDELIVVVLDPSRAGVHGERAESTNREIVTHLTLDAVAVGAAEVVAGPADGGRATRFAYERALVGLAALQLGVAEEALAQAAAYTSGRIQFGKPLSSFQSTAARAADAYIDTEAIRATLWQAAWRLDRALDASTEVEVAKWWAADAGQRVVHTTQHLHGGMGADIEYPIHRYFLWGKQIEDTLGGASAHLARVGAALAGNMP
ncbi:MAG: acyl-CoA dehydrogenase family protein [Acidimicrobiales bacterium]